MVAFILRIVAPFLPFVTTGEKYLYNTLSPSLMNNFLSAILRVIFAIILGLAAVVTTILLSPFMLVMWLFKNLTGKPPK
jgi:hypothetical protein